jgi:RNase P protein component
MIKKNYRLSANEVKKVLKYWKPFFSYWLVANYIWNNLNYNRYAIIIWWKSVNLAVSRVFFRRLFYNLVSFKIKEGSKDVVFVLKKQIKLDKKDSLSIKSFENDINFLLKKI